jgi:uncharacterized protein (DUF433 family)
MTTDDLLRRIVVNHAILRGKPVVRGTRISVELVLGFLAAGETVEGLLDNYPDLTPDDIRACLAYAHALVADTSIDAIDVVNA